MGAVNIDLKNLVEKIVNQDLRISTGKPYEDERLYRLLIQRKEVVKTIKLGYVTDQANAETFLNIINNEIKQIIGL